MTECVKRGVKLYLLSYWLLLMHQSLWLLQHIVLCRRVGCIVERCYPLLSVLCCFCWCVNC